MRLFGREEEGKVKKYIEREILNKFPTHILAMYNIDPDNASRRICRCSTYCGSSGKSVSVATYNRHARDRHRDQFGAGLGTFLASLQPDQNSAPQSKQKRSAVPNMASRIRKAQRVDSGNANPSSSGDFNVEEHDNSVRPVYCEFIRYLLRW